MKMILKELLSALYILVFLYGPVMAETERKTAFRENFSSKNLSSQWGMGAFSLYNFKADTAMVSNSSGLNYLKLGLSKSSIYPAGLIYTKERFPYGSYSAKIKVSNMPGGCSKFLYMH